MSLTLRDYQLDIIEKARQKMREGCKRFLITSPTGSGKTVLTAHMLQTAASKGMDSLFLVHRRELIKQSVLTFSSVGVRHGIVAAGFAPDPKPHIQIGSIGTVGNRLHKIRAPKLIIWDECHHLAANSWAKIFKAFPNSFHIGLTATPQRLDRKALGEFFESMIRGPEVEWLISEGYLTKYIIFAPPGPSMEEVHVRMGDFSKHEVSEIFNKPQILGDSLKIYKKHADGKRAIVFCPGVSHSENLVSTFKVGGVSAKHVDGNSEEVVRDGTIRAFKENDLSVLSNVGLFGEGFDVPAIDAVIDCSPTLSLSAYLQRFGRCLRPNYKKGMPLDTREERLAAIAASDKPFATYLDQAGNVMRHGLPDEVREWSLDGEKKRKKEESKVKLCEKCMAANSSFAKVCVFCNEPFQVRARVIEQVPGDLVQIDPNEIRRLRAKEQGSARTYEQLVELGRKRNYRRAELWAKHMMIARANKKQGA
jgi:superfamily II DNA or RNA helicase